MDKKTKIVMISVVANLLLLYFFINAFEFISAAIYLGLAFAVIKSAKFNNMKASSYFIMGALISATYNVGLSTLGLFSVATTFIVLAAIQQGLLTFITSKVMGAK